MVRRGEIVILKIPYLDGNDAKVRPALVLQSDTNNRRLQHTIVAMFTGNISRAEREPTQLLVDPATAEGRSSGLNGPSALKAESLYTVEQSEVRHVIGSLSPALMKKVGECLKSSRDLK